MRLISWSYIMMKLPEGKEKNRCSEEEVDWYTNLQNMSYQKIYTFWYYVVNGEVPSASSQIIEQIEVIQEVVLPGLSKLND